MIGRKCIPKSLKVLSGERRPSRLNRNEPIAPSGMAEPPEWLNERAAAHFRRVSNILDGIGIASPADVDTLAMLALRCDEIEACTMVIEDAGRTFRTTAPSGDQMHRPRPEIAMRNQAMRHAQSLLSEFGLSPAARAKVSAAVPWAQNPFQMIDFPTSTGANP